MYRQVILYAVRGRWDGRDIIEGSDVIVKTKDGQEISGRLQDVGHTNITIYDYDNDTEYCIEYENIKKIED